MPREKKSPKGILDEVDELEAKRTKRKQEPAKKDDELDLDKIW